MLGAKAWCPVWVLSKIDKQRFDAWCCARIRCGFPVKKGFSVGIRIQVGRAGCGQFRMLCGCGGGAVRVQGCGLISKQGLGAGLSAVR